MRRSTLYKDKLQIGKLRTAVLVFVHSLPYFHPVQKMIHQKPYLLLYIFPFANLSLNTSLSGVTSGPLRTSAGSRIGYENASLLLILLVCITLGMLNDINRSERGSGSSYSAFTSLHKSSSAFASSWRVWKCAWHAAVLRL